MTPRSYLFVPGDRPERFDKALASGAHAVILDLEDAVLPERKDVARAALQAWLAAATARVHVRINPHDTPWYDADCELLAHPAVQGVMLPKSQDAGQVRALAQRLHTGQHLIPLVETVEGTFQAEAMARVAGVQRLAFGSVDFMADSGIECEDGLDPVRVQLVLASRRAQVLAPVDGVSLSIDDAAVLHAQALRSRQMGFGAKLCIHPRQVDPVHQAFRPSEAERAWAQRVVDAMAGQPLGAVAVDGKLVDRPVLLRAQAVLAQA